MALMNVVNPIGYVTFPLERKTTGKGKNKREFMPIVICCQTGYGDYENVLFYKAFIFDERMMERLENAGVDKGSRIQLVGVEHHVETFEIKQGDREGEIGANIILSPLYDWAFANSKSDDDDDDDRGGRRNSRSKKNGRNSRNGNSRRHRDDDDDEEND